LSLLESERISIQFSPGEPVPTLAVGAFEWAVYSGALPRWVNSCWKSVIWKGAVVKVGNPSMLVVVMKFMGAIDMEFIMCELIPNSTGEVSNGPPYVLNPVLIPIVPCP
jgi:hypothetical protein